MSAEPAYERFRPPPGGFTAEDLDRIPGLPPHTELIDGSLVFVSPQKLFHMKTLRLLEQALARSAPPERFRVRREMSVVLGPHQRPEPDLIVVSADADIDNDQTWYPADAVSLAVEVVSPDSWLRDRERKPQLYAKAGIPHFWRVEEADGQPTVYVHELLEAQRVYQPIGIFHGRVKVSTPFELDIDLTEIDRL
ncbi:Uma2 family endonuclease [Micromonospora sp. WMMD1102]|uniref:Uma2 family endonuclease n=1 Tax=Micromonospora sp. WMMD1102 TaxID=3016105 RepID=UPI002414D676|nr:Uma2 family endonuclease [Micromonospora sp. WMMD1102]MDG4785690.1 Uma2 family endonuclease [Micromonospora sp. WMMD1102]MDG4792163.1 Uma2 family endonuclease [Micromonospora sp. WMMD1102]